ncbi:MAG: response regulator [Candidatus Giovannonibacteria bacterium]|nr:response regulator [Candidatus Giovannonibacteria bacterium]
MNPNTKVLIVDDDAFLLDMYSIKFKESGFLVEIAKNGEEALEKAKSSNPDVILLDIVMPKMDGFDVLREIKKENIAPNAAIFILTNLGQKEDVDRGLKLGANDYIVKAHFTPSEVVNKVRNFLGPKQPAADDFHL